jgi:Ca-activated chloride channel family protein
MSKVKAAWRADRKPANVLLVVDTSGSMNDAGRLDRAKQGLSAFFRTVSPRDRVGLLAFNDKLQLLEPLNEFSANRNALRERVRGLVADGGTAIYDATAAGFEQVRRLAGNGRINAVVVLTDGEDTDSHKNADDVVNAVRGQGDSSRQVRIFTIAYSAGAQGAEQALRNIAQASGGQEYKGDTEDIESVYRSISSFF